MTLLHQYSGFLDSHVLWNSNTLFELLQFNFEEITKETSRSSSKLPIEIRENEVLGKRIEQFFEYFINSSKRYEVIAKNIQVIHNGLTLGEFDFFIKDRISKHILHIELVCKFYVYDPDIENELQRWIGPNRKDALLQKIEKIKNKQLPLLFREEAKPILEDLQLSHNIIQQQVCYIANLFIPHSLRSTIFPYINPKCIRGYWMRFDEFIKDKYVSYSFHIPQKQHWIVDPKNCNTWSSFDKIYKDVKSLCLQKKSPLLWINNGDSKFERVFIVWW